MAKYTCSKCGWAYNGRIQPQRCPKCYATTFIEQNGTSNSTSANVTYNRSSIKQEVGMKPSSNNHIERNAQKNKPLMQGVSVVSVNVVAEQDIARLVQQEVNKEIAKLNAQGKRVINVSAGSTAKNIIGMKHHITILWESV